MRFHETGLQGAWVIDLDRHGDDRGFFARAFCEREFADHGLPTHFPQCNLSNNTTAGTLRGMHFNIAAHFESKVVRCVRGGVHDVIVDIRPGSATEGRWFGTELTADNGRAVYVPEGFAHGFITLAADSDVFYQMGAVYQPDAARGFRWDDPQFAIAWPMAPTVISERDAEYPDYEPSVLQ